MTKHFSVAADPDTGEWMTEPELEGEVNLLEFDLRPDTEEAHFDTFERDGEICALSVFWIEV